MAAALVQAIGPVLLDANARPNALQGVGARYELVLVSVADDHRVAIFIGQVTAERVAGEQVVLVGPVQEIIAQFQRAALALDVIGLGLQAVGHPLVIEQTVRALLVVHLAIQHVVANARQKAVPTDVAEDAGVPQVGVVVTIAAQLTVTWR